MGINKLNELKVGLVIVTYNSDKYILNCLASIKKTAYPNLSIVIVDNASTDNTVSLLKTKSYVHLIKNSRNTGFAKGCNQGIRYLLKKNAQYVVLLNPDTVVEQNLIHELLKPFTKDPSILAVGPIITYLGHPNKIWFGGGYFNSLFCYTRHQFMDQTLTEANVTSGTTDFITGACICIKSVAFDKVGNLPEEYFLYFEDVHFCQKIRQAGFKCYLLAKPLVLHAVSASTGISGTNGLSCLRAYYYARNTLLYALNNVKGSHKFTSIIGQFFIRLPYYQMQLIKEKKLKSMIAYLQGLYDGILQKEGPLRDVFNE